MGADWYAWRGGGGGGDYGRAGSMQRQARVQGDIDADSGYVRDLEIAGTLRLADGGKIVDADDSEWSDTGIILRGAGSWGDSIKWVDSGTSAEAGGITATADGVWLAYGDGVDTFYAIVLTETYGLLGIASPGFNNVGVGFVKVNDDGSVQIGTTSAYHYFGADNAFHLPDGIAAPSATSGRAKLYVDAADGDLKVKFGDGTTKTIATDT